MGPLVFLLLVKASAGILEKKNAQDMIDFKLKEHIPIIFPVSVYILDVDTPPEQLLIANYI